jgi:hypothetical protein
MCVHPKALQFFEYDLPLVSPRRRQIQTPCYLCSVYQTGLTEYLQVHSLPSSFFTDYVDTFAKENAGKSATGFSDSD